ncbi:MAG: Flp family type IVb pilin [Alphaproteobacteria bacterium]|nr:Flp family type IVb pilin [Alphaproteobacteria bacterium]MDE2336832.1 Flp family type IVb pilin [Alphaproteobacteria bacterium]
MDRLFFWFSDSKATTAIEYSLIVGGIAVAISAVVFTVGSDLKVLFDQVGAMAAKF